MEVVGDNKQYVVFTGFVLYDGNEMKAVFSLTIVVKINDELDKFFMNQGAYMLKDKLIQYSQEIGIDQIGFTTADVFQTLKGRLEEQQSKGYQSGFEEPDISKRTEPKRLLSDAHSIIAIAIAYPSKMSAPPKGGAGERRGIFCRASWGMDYHQLLKQKLRLLEAFIQKEVPAAKCISMVDTGELVDRAVAERAGIGWSAKNCSIISPKFGSYIYLGELVTNLVFEPDIPVESKCGDCRKCIDACPTQAFVAPGQLDAKRCIAFLTQTKTAIPEIFRDKIGNRLYGCDTCQVVCPLNQKLDFHLHPALEPDPGIARPLLKPILNLSNRQFKSQFGTVAGSWRGRTPIQRNAIYALAFFKDRSSLPLLKELTYDQRDVIRDAAEWAIAEIESVEIDY